MAQPSANPQAGSLLLHKLPQELRDEIYSHVFFSTRFCWGDRAIARIGRRRVVSANRGKSLALLRTCRRIHNEIGSNWLSQVLFHFETPEALLDTLTPLKQSVLGGIRHIRISGDPLMVSYEDDDVYYRTSQVLKLIPGLNLNRLTVLGNRDEQISYQTLSRLIEASDGWKELHYLSHHSLMLAYSAQRDIFGDDFFDQYLRKPQPGNWQAVLNKRDGKSTNPSVTVYQATSAAPGSVWHPTKRRIISQQLGPRQSLTDYSGQADKILTSPAERDKELLIIVKRGSGVEYAESSPTSYLTGGDIREDSSGQTWAEIKEMTKFSDDDEDDEYFKERQERKDAENALVDEYDHVDEYTWPPLHFSRD